MGMGTWIFGIGFLVMLGVLLLVFGPDIKRHFRSQQMLASGVTASARVTDVHDTGNRYNHNPQVRLELEVQPEGRASFMAEVTVVLSAVDLLKLQPGTLVTVKYDPQRPTEVALVYP